MITILYSNLEACSSIFERNNPGGVQNCGHLKIVYDQTSFISEISSLAHRTSEVCLDPPLASEISQIVLHCVWLQ